MQLKNLTKIFGNNFLYSIVISAIFVISFFIYLCFGLFCYCNTVVYPHSYTCKPSLLSSSELTQSTCAAVTMNYFFTFMRFFEGFTDQDMHWFTAIGALAEIGYMVGITGSLIVSTIIYYKRTAISVEILEAEVNRIGVNVKENQANFKSEMKQMTDNCSKLVNVVKLSMKDQETLFTTIDNYKDKSLEIIKQQQKQEFSYREMRQAVLRADMVTKTLVQQVEHINEKIQSGDLTVDQLQRDLRKQLQDNAVSISNVRNQLISQRNSSTLPSLQNQNQSRTYTQTSQRSFDTSQNRSKSPNSRRRRRSGQQQ